MLDDLRQQGADMEFLEEELDQPSAPPKADPNIILGMTPVQRLVISIMVFLMTSMVLSFLLLVTGKITPSFLY